MPHLIHCPSCRKEVSSDAIRCPHCGRNIRSYVKARAYNKPHDDAISKAAGIICLVIIGSLLLTLFAASVSVFFFVTSSSNYEMHEIAEELSADKYDGHYKSTADALRVAGTVSAIVTVALGIFLTFVSVKVSKKQAQIIKKEKALLLSEEYFSGK